MTPTELIKPVAGKKLLYVMAVDTEYKTALKDRFTPLLTGVGPIEAAVALTAALDELAAGGGLPDLVVSLGSAGARHLKQTQVYQATTVAYRDIDASPFGFEKGQTPYLDMPAAMPLPFTIPNVQTARLSTGAAVIAGPAYNDVDADMVDMETFAVLRACQRFDIPLVALRGISDGEDDVESVHDWLRYLDIVDENLATAVDRLEAEIAAGRIAL